jgi:hypothetical protein
MKNNHLKIQLDDELYFKKLAYCLFLILIGYSLYLLNKLPVAISWEKAYLAMGIIWLGMLPSLLYLVNSSREPIPFFSLIGIFYAFSFGLPILLPGVKSSDQYSILAVTKDSLFLVFLGILEMNLVFFIIKIFAIKNIKPINFPFPYSTRRLLNILIIFLLLHLAYFYIPLLQQIPSVGQILEPVGYIAYGMFFILWSNNQLRSNSLKLFIIICFLLEFLKRFTSGALAQVLFLGLYMLLIIWYQRKRLPIVLISASLLFFLTFNSIKGEYRSLVWGGDYSQSNPIEQAQLFVDLAIKRYVSADQVYQQEDNYSSSTDSAINRTAYIVLFSEVMEDTPKPIPYWGGETYLNLFTSFIPRAIWSDKPTENIGNIFGRRYGYLNQDDDVTSLNLPWLVELYANFGELGVLFGMPLLGAFLAIIDLKLNSPNMNSLEVVIGSTIIFKLIDQESNFSLMVGSLLPFILTIYLIFRLLSSNLKGYKT